MLQKQLCYESNWSNTDSTEPVGGNNTRLDTVPYFNIGRSCLYRYSNDHVETATMHILLSQLRLAKQKQM